MSAELQQLTTDVAVLEERMETRQAEYKTDIARLAEDTAKRDAEMTRQYKTDIGRLAEDAAKRDAEMTKQIAGYKTDIGRLAEDSAKRETRLVITVAGMLALSVAILGTLISFQN